MKYTETHEWIRVDENIGTVGITEHAGEELGEIVFVQLPKVGQKVEKDEEIVILESTKAAADIYAPCSGEIVAVNENLLKEPSLLNDSPHDLGWLVKIAPENIAEIEELLNQEQYGQLIN